MTSPFDPHISETALARSARRARLALSGDDHRRLAEELSSVMALLRALQTADLARVSPLLHLHDASAPPREDAVFPSLPREEALRNAPDSDGAYVRVPRVL